MNCYFTCQKLSKFCKTCFTATKGAALAPFNLPHPEYTRSCVVVKLERGMDHLRHRKANALRGRKRVDARMWVAKMPRRRLALQQQQRQKCISKSGTVMRKRRSTPTMHRAKQPRTSALTAGLVVARSLVLAPRRAPLR